MKRNDALRRALAAAIALTLAGSAACAQPPAPSAGAPAAPVPADVDSVLPRADRDRAKGVQGAPLTVVEVSDFQCPFCRQWTETTYRQFDSAYVRTGKVRMVFINYPLPNHPRAYAAAEAAMCAGAQGKFWAMHDRLFATQREWSGMADAARRFDALASEIGLEMGAYRDCTANDRVAQLIIGDALKAAGGGISGTPSFVINGTRFLGGAVTFDQMKTELDAALANPAAPTPPPPSN